MNKRYLRWLLPVGLIAILLGQIVGRPELRALCSSDYWSNWWRYGQVIRLVEAEYVHADDVNFEEFTDVALQGAVRALDRYSDYMTPGEFDDFNMAANQKYVGVGVEIAQFGGRIVIAQVFPQGSAHEAGILAGDFIVSVGDQDVREQRLSDVSELIRGEPESNVALAVERIGESAPLDFTLTRRAITLDAVTDVELKTETGVGYLKLRQFTDAADVEMIAALEQLEREGMRGLIVDVRGNPGGRLMIAAYIAELFLEEGQRILSVESRRGESDVVEARATEHGFQGPMMVLMDGSSASASEILAGALRDHQRAVLVGEKSYGKGSVQGVYQFRSGQALKLTSARYLLPMGEAINGTGVFPDIEVTVPTEDRVLLMLQRHHTRTMDAATFTSQFGFAPVEDQQLNAAMEMLESVLTAKQVADL